MILVGEMTILLTNQFGLTAQITPLLRIDWLTNLPRWVAALALVSVFPAVEEVLFRGVIFGALRRAGDLGAAILTSVSWSLWHAMWPPQIFVMYLVFGLALAWVRIRTERVWPCIVAHSIYNAIPAAILIINLTRLA